MAPHGTVKRKAAAMVGQTCRCIPLLPKTGPYSRSPTRLNGESAACLMQRWRKLSAIKPAWIAEAQPVLCKDSASRAQYSSIGLPKRSLSYAKIRQANRKIKKRCIYLLICKDRRTSATSAQRKECVPNQTDFPLLPLSCTSPNSLPFVTYR